MTKKSNLENTEKENKKIGKKIQKETKKKNKEEKKEIAKKNKEKRKEKSQKQKPDAIRIVTIIIVVFLCLVMILSVCGTLMYYLLA